MPKSIQSPCSIRGCPNAAWQGGRCREHQVKKVSGSKRGYTNWAELRREFLETNPECELCGRPATDVHHIVPLNEGGANAWDNLQALCHPCHSSVTIRESGLHRLKLRESG